MTGEQNKQFEMGFGFKRQDNLIIYKKTISDIQLEKTKRTYWIPKFDHYILRPHGGCECRKWSTRSWAEV